MFWVNISALDCGKLPVVQIVVHPGVWVASFCSESYQQSQAVQEYGNRYQNHRERA